MNGDGHAERCACPAEGGQTGRPQARLGRDTADEKPHEATDSLQLTWHTTYHTHLSVDLPEWWSGLRIVGICLLASFLFGDAVASLLHLPRLIVYSSLLSLLGVYIVFLLWQIRSLRRSSDTPTDQSLEGNLSLSGKGNPRLECYGTRRELSDLKLDGQFREPFIAAATLSRYWLWVFVLSWAVIEGVIGGLDASQQVNAMLKVSIYLLAGSAIVVAPRNLYYRVAPRRLDILRGRMWRTSLTCRKRIPLDRERIRCRFDQQKLYAIQPDAADGEQDVIELRRLAEPHAFVKAVFEAAVSPHPTPPLPDDALLG